MGMGRDRGVRIEGKMRGDHGEGREYRRWGHDHLGRRRDVGRRIGSGSVAIGR